MVETEGPESGRDDPGRLLVGECLERIEREGQGALELMCVEHPEHATMLRLRVGLLGRAGLLDEASESEAASPAMTLGDFRLLRPLGKGGMGEVWEAEQISLGRKVALKTLLPERVDWNGLQYFAREARAGARLSHPGIVTVYGSGEDEGVAWIAMELVEGGCTLQEFIGGVRDEAELPEGYYPQVAKLLVLLADALAVAHDAGVIHRDLKPQNVLIAPDDRPKLADFGLARMTDEEGLSQTGDFAGTYFYMSPEQVMARRMGIDHRTDVFSLGAMMYELLTLRRPFDGDTPHQIAEQIMLEDPPEARTVRSRVPADLAVICGKALQKQPSRRYQTMAELSADLRRHLASEPILARPPSAAQRALKWVRRHPTASVSGAVGAACTLVIALLAVVAWRSAGEARASAQELARTNAELTVSNEEAEQARDDAVRVAKFQSRMLLDLDAFALGQTLLDGFEEGVAAHLRETSRSEAEVEESLAAFRDLALRAPPTDVAKRLLDEKILARAGDLIDAEFAGDPTTEATLRQALADVYGGLGLYERALPQQERAMTLRREVLGDDNPETLASLAKMGVLFGRQGKLDEADAYLRKAHEDRGRVLGNEHEDTLASLGNLANLRMIQGRFAEAEVLIEEALDTYRRIQAGETHDALACMSQMAALLSAQGKLDEAEQFYIEALEGCRRTLGDEHPNTLGKISNMGALLLDLGKLGEAEALCREAMVGLRSSLGDTHPDTLTAINNLGAVLATRGSLAEAEPLYREALEGCIQALGNEHLDTLGSMENLGYLHLDQGELDEAEPYFREALEAKRRVLGEENPYLQYSIENLARVLMEQGELTEAEALAREVLDLTPEDSPEHPARQQLLAEVLAARKQSEPTSADESDG